MLEVRQSEVFKAWLAGLRDVAARLRIGARIRRLEGGNAGDAKMLVSGVGEMRIDHGAGYRVYFTRRGDTVVVLLCGGDKRTQRADIARAVQMAKEL